MPYVYQTKQRKQRYWIRDRWCIGRACFAPGIYQIRGAIGAAGSKSSGETFMCMTNAYHGCPVDGKPIREYDPKLKKKRAAEGWKFSRIP